MSAMPRAGPLRAVIPTPTVITELLVSSTGLGYGERLPDFRRHAADGSAVFAYDLADGRPWLLVVLGAATVAWADAARTALAPADESQRRVLLLALPPDALGAATPGIQVLADDGAVTGWMLGAAPAAVFTLDPNQRVLAREDVTDASQFSAALARGRALLAARPAGQVSVHGGGAPVLIVPEVLEPALCTELMALYDREGGLPSGQLHLEGGRAELRVDLRYKSRRDYQRFDATWTARLSTLLARRVLPEVDKCFAFRADSFEPFKLACYDAGEDGGEGGYHRPHRDNLTRDVEERRFALSVNLNTGGYAGGELRFPEYGPDLYLPPAGAAAVFSSSMLHEARPVTRGRRFVLLTFLACATVRGPHLYHQPR
jgi:predicted 2-oxoglutarate/Fe(II)-dependent dioxygenase YbiX